MEEERAQAKAVADDLYEYFREHMRGHMRDASRDGSRENLPATTLVEQAGHPDHLDQEDANTQAGGTARFR